MIIVQLRNIVCRRVAGANSIPALFWDIMWQGRTFAFGTQSVDNALGREIDGGIVPSNDHCRVLFLIARAKAFSLWMSRMNRNDQILVLDCKT